MIPSGCQSIRVGACRAAPILAGTAMNERVAPTVSSAANRKPVTDLRAWLDVLAASDRLAGARPGVNLRFELAALAKKLGGEQGTVFSRRDGHAVPVLSGLTSDRGWMAEAMGVSNDRLLATFQDAALNPLPCREVAAAPPQGVVHREVDLARLLPIPVHNELDSGPYITAGLLIARNPKTGAQNVPIHRLQLSGPNRLGVLLLPRHTLRFFQMAEEAGNDLAVAIVIEVDPLILLPSSAIAPPDLEALTI